MRLFCKHFFRTIRRAPLQPILIVLTVALAVASSVVSFRLPRVFEHHAEDVNRNLAESGDILVSLRGDSNVRFLFCEDAEDALDGAGTVLGEYVLTAFLPTEEKTELLSVSATDLVAADDFYQFRFTAYGQFTAENLDASAVVSESAAKRYGWRVGDQITISLLGEKLTYTVQAIAKPTGLLAERDILISAQGILRRVIASAPALAGMELKSMPCTRLMIRLDDPTRDGEILARLLEKTQFAKMAVCSTREGAGTDYYLFAERMSLGLLAAVLILLSGILTATSQQLLEQERQTSRALFRVAGASQGQMAVAQFAESAVYALVGAVCGSLLARPMLEKACARFDWYENGATVGISGYLFGFVLSFGLMLASTAIRLFSERRDPLSALLGEPDLRARKRQGTILLVVFGVLSLLSIGIALALPTQKRYLPSLFAIFFCAMTLYEAVPFVLRWISVLLSQVTDRFARPQAWIWLIARNVRNRFSICHVGRLFALTLAFLILMLSSQRALSEQIRTWDTAPTADICAVHVPEETVEEINGLQAVRGTAWMTVFPVAELPGNITYTAVSIEGNAEACLRADLLPSRLPKGNEAVISEGVSELLGIGVGDVLNLTVGGVACQLTVSECISGNLIFFDAQSLGLFGERVFCVRATEASAIEDLVGKLESNGAILTDPKVMLGEGTDIMSGFLDLVWFFVLLCGGLMAVGCANVFLEQHRAGKAERERLNHVGVTAREVMLWEWAETGLVLAISAICAVAFGWVLCRLAEYAMGSFGFIVNL